ncbi:unnamed protein product [Boreogadus saida]
MGRLAISKSYFILILKRGKGTGGWEAKRIGLIGLAISFGGSPAEKGIVLPELNYRLPPSYPRRTAAEASAAVWPLPKLRLQSGRRQSRPAPLAVYSESGNAAETSRLLRRVSSGARSQRRSERLIGRPAESHGPNAAFEYSLRTDSDLGSDATPTLQAFYYFARSLEENMAATQKAVVAVALAEDQAIQYK